jgi:hypothetical protein
LGDTKPLEDAAEDAREAATQELKESRDAASGVLETTGAEAPALETKTETKKE